MWVGLEAEVKGAAQRRIQDFETYLKAVHDENLRRKRRSIASPELLTVERPKSWTLDQGFNPYLVRSRSVTISHAITKKLKKGNYQPSRPSGFAVPKSSGGSRSISSFPIADEVISNRLFRSLMRKNHSRLSSRAYAYRADLTPHDAIAHIRNNFKSEQRLFVAEYDFSKFFSMVSHDYLWSTLDNLGMVRTPLENTLIERFLAASEPYFDERDKSISGQARTRGLPEGTSISLFLANVVASPIDRALEGLGVGFARYADDTLIWSRSYDQICEAAEVLHAAAEAIGSPINVEKSPGVRLLVPHATKHLEMTGTKTVDYLGHTFGLRTLQMKKVAIAKIKRRVQALLFANLLREPLGGSQDLNRLTDMDRDYVTYVWQLRRYLYGPLSENQVRRFQQGSVPDIVFEGVMSFFPMVDHDQELLNLDVWIATQTWLTLKKRMRLLAAETSKVPVPWGAEIPQLIRLETTSRSTGAPVDLRLPSIRRISSVIRTAVSTHGFRAASSGSDLYLYEDS